MLKSKLRFTVGNVGKIASKHMPTLLGIKIYILYNQPLKVRGHYAVSFTRNSPNAFRLCWINPPTFGTFFIQVDAPFETIRYCGLNGEITVHCWFPKWFWMVHVGQLIQNLVWILQSGESMDPLKPFEWIWMVVQLATNTVQMVSPCVYKPNGHFWKWKFWMVSNGLSVGGLMVYQ